MLRDIVKIWMVKFSEARAVIHQFAKVFLHQTFTLYGIYGMVIMHT